MSRKPKILVVEDETPVSMMMVFLLTRAGYETQVASTGKEAMQKTQESDFDLITLDVDLPDISGFEICNELKQRHASRHTPMVFISGNLVKKNDSTASTWAQWITSPSRLKPPILSHAFFHALKMVTVPI